MARIALAKADTKQGRKSVSAPNSDLNKVQLVPAVVTYGRFVARIALAKANAKQGRKSDGPPISAVLCQVVILRAVSTQGIQQ